MHLPCFCLSCCLFLLSARRTQRVPAQVPVHPRHPSDWPASLGPDQRQTLKLGQQCGLEKSSQPSFSLLHCTLYLDLIHLQNISRPKRPTPPKRDSLPAPRALSTTFVARLFFRSFHRQRRDAEAPSLPLATPSPTSPFSPSCKKVRAFRVRHRGSTHRDAEYPPAGAAASARGHLQDV